MKGEFKMTVQIATLCGVCQEVDTIEVDSVSYGKWCAGEFIQDAMPELDADKREQLISGTCPECFDKMFEEFDE
jgi:hypothetical protein